MALVIYFLYKSSADSIPTFVGNQPDAPTFFEVRIFLPVLSEKISLAWSCPSSLKE